MLAGRGAVQREPMGTNREFARRLWAGLLRSIFVLAWVAAISDHAGAQGKYPDKPVKMLVGFSAGGGTDVIARIVAQKMSDGLGQSVLVENRAGASGLIAADMTAKSAP